MTRQISGLRADPLPWLLEREDPAVRYLALRDLEGRPADDAELAEARAAAYASGPIAAILDAMQPAGYWVEPGAGYAPKYRGSVWALLTLAQMGASVTEDARLATACAYLLNHAQAAHGGFSAQGSGAPSASADCLTGNLLAAFLDLGYDDPRLAEAFAWEASVVTGEGMAPRGDRSTVRRYYGGQCGPGYACGANDEQPCAWGAVKVLLAGTRWPAARRTPALERALQQAVDLLLGVDPATAAYPSAYTGKPSGAWWQFRFPVFYVTDLLQVAEALVGAGYGADPRLANLLALIRAKQDGQGRWAQEYTYGDKVWVDVGVRKQPNKWVTLRALRVVQSAG